jgi:hypothetical protein
VIGRVLHDFEFAVREVASAFPIKLHVVSILRRFYEETLVQKLTMVYQVMGK